MNVEDEYSKAQWWFKELEATLSEGTTDQRRALVVVEKLIKDYKDLDIRAASYIMDLKFEIAKLHKYKVKYEDLKSK